MLELEEDKSDYCIVSRQCSQLVVDNHVAWVVVLNRMCNHNLDKDEDDTNRKDKVDLAEVQQLADDYPVHHSVDRMLERNSNSLLEPLLFD